MTNNSKHLEYCRAYDKRFKEAGRKVVFGRLSKRATDQFDRLTALWGCAASEVIEALVLGTIAPDLRIVMETHRFSREEALAFMEMSSVQSGHADTSRQAVVDDHHSGDSHLYPGADHHRVLLHVDHRRRRFKSCRRARRAGHPCRWNCSPGRGL